MDKKPNLWQRLTGPTPPFWKSVRRYALAITGAGGGVLGATLTPGFSPDTLPDWLITAASYAVAIGGSITAFASAQLDPNPSPKDEN
jgi:hypothetical protein